ncbi:N-acetylneuraminate synthase family protein [Morganella morganii]|uniref:N-acetylneuraminate synthase family protein n=1 Tax=Morganella morganii TaxID=582 RepID=UPI0032DBB2EA
MKIGVIILARMTSSRLPGKGLREIHNKPILQWIIDALALCNNIDQIILATSVLPSDDELNTFAEKSKISIYRGSLDNVAERFMMSAKATNLDAAIRINGDNLFVNPFLVDYVANELRNGNEFVSNIVDRTFPRGMSVEGVNIKTYCESYNNFKDEYDFEHVMPYFYRNLSRIKSSLIKNSKCVNAANKQIAIDTQKDFYLASNVMNHHKTNQYDLNLDELVKEFEIQERKMNFIGQHGPLLIAEIGGNHEGDFEYAKKLAHLAIESDADFIKFQIYSGNTLVNSVESPDRHKHFKKFELSREQYVELAKVVTSAGKKFMASIWDIDMIEWVDEYNPIYKIGSGDLLAWPLLKNIATRGKPIILSTGLATEEEVLATVEFIRECNPLYLDSNYLSVLQCTSMYPIPKSAANLSVMSRLKNLTNTTIGYSDHTEGSDALKYAIAMGAQVLEFHFTDTRENKQFRDHKVSLTRDEVLELIEYIKDLNVMLGNNEKKPTQIELDNNHEISFRRAVYPAKDLAEGTILTEDDLVILRPSHGISSRDYYQLIGAKLKRPLKKGEKLSWDFFDIKCDN